ncbi:MAG: 1-acyl-sn-glycerol-3-phosphate acyltransferase [Firmicutes bacterium]|nr:1-acyl-sn-glycerol-3-phosphate acyltransferase [Bacillota bacterium]
MRMFLYSVGYTAFKLYFKLAYKFKINGQNNIPENGPFVVMANHITLFDPPIVACSLEHRKTVHFMAKQELFKNPLFGYILKKVGAFPVKRGRADKGAIRKAFNILENRGVLGIFPEGSRQKPGKLGRAKSGSVMIPIKMKVPILPMSIKIEKREITVSIGKLFELDKYYNRKVPRNELKEAGDIIMEKINQQLLLS